MESLLGLVLALLIAIQQPNVPPEVRAQAIQVAQIAMTLNVKSDATSTAKVVEVEDEIEDVQTFAADESALVHDVEFKWEKNSEGQPRLAVFVSGNWEKVSFELVRWNGDKLMSGGWATEDYSNQLGRLLPGTHTWTSNAVRNGVTTTKTGTYTVLKGKQGGTQTELNEAKANLANMQVRLSENTAKKQLAESQCPQSGCTDMQKAEIRDAEFMIGTANTGIANLTLLIEDLEAALGN